MGMTTYEIRPYDAIVYARGTDEDDALANAHDVAAGLLRARVPGSAPHVSLLCGGRRATRAAVTIEWAESEALAASVAFRNHMDAWIMSR
jgi:hypothetical protein